jgi:hypothetical protein
MFLQIAKAELAEKFPILRAGRRSIIQYAASRRIASWASERWRIGSKTRWPERNICYLGFSPATGSNDFVPRFGFRFGGSENSFPLITSISEPLGAIGTASVKI